MAQSVRIVVSLENFFLHDTAVGAPHVNPIDRVMKEGVIVGLANHSRPLRFEETSPEVARREMMALMTAPIADMLLSAFAAAVGKPAPVTSTVEQVTGTPARSFRDWAVDHAIEFAK